MATDLSALDGKTKASTASETAAGLTSFGTNTTVPSGGSGTAVPFTSSTAATWWSAGAPTRLTCPSGENGVYVIRANLRWQGALTGIRRAKITVDGADFEAVQFAGNASDEGILVVSRPLNINVAQYVQLVAYQDSGTDKVVLGASDWTSLALWRVG